MFLIFAQGTFYIFHNVVVVLRHLAADDIRAFIFRRTDNSAFQYGMGGQCKVINAMEMSRPLAEARTGLLPEGQNRLH